MSRRWWIGAVALAAPLVLWPVSASERAAEADMLPSWNDGSARKAILDFVGRVTDRNSKDYVSRAERIAVFDNDGTLWCEQPMYVQLAFALDRVKALAPDHPEWKDKEPFKSALAGDLTGVAASGKKGLVELFAATHGGMTVEAFGKVVKDWLATARHPRFKRPYTECVYQPMLELLTYLRANGFKTYITSGGGADFMRPWTEKAYGIPPEQVIGSTGNLKYEERGGKPVLMRLPGIEFLDDGAGKPVAIHKHIGRRPIAALGNSDGDYEMLRYVTAGGGPRLGLIVHHTDKEREYAYDRASPFGRLNKALDEAGKRGWVVADMKKDWKTILAPAK
jgi:phosphoglycolate phosphatase-like HAD superfamily hydrolase